MRARVSTLAASSGSRHPGEVNPRKNWPGRRATGRKANAQASASPSNLSNIGETKEAVG